MSSNRPVRPLPALFQHGKHGKPGLTDLSRCGAHDVTRHDRGRRLAERAGFDFMVKIADAAIRHLEIDLDPRAAELGVLFGAGIGVIQLSGPLDIAGEFEDFGIVDVVHNRPGTSLGGLYVLRVRLDRSHPRDTVLRAHSFTPGKSLLYVRSGAGPNKSRAIMRPGSGKGRTDLPR